VVLVAAPFAFGHLADAGADVSGRFFGSVLGDVTPPLALSVVGSNWVRRRRERQAQAALLASDPEPPISPPPP
jgi:hypothetical protein